MDLRPETGRDDDAFTPVPPRPEADSFDDVVIPHLEVLYRAARSITGNPFDADDLVQDALLRAMRSWGTFDGRHPRAWLLTIMRNANINRHRRRRPSLLRNGDVTTAADRHNPPAMSAEDVATTLDLSVLAGVLERVPERLRCVVQLVDVEGLGCHDAATVLGVPVGTVMSRLHRGRQKMRTDLLRHHPEFRKNRP